MSPTASNLYFQELDLIVQPQVILSSSKYVTRDYPTVCPFYRRMKTDDQKTKWALQTQAKGADFIRAYTDKWLQNEFVKIGCRDLLKMRHNIIGGDTLG